MGCPADSLNSFLTCIAAHDAPISGVSLLLEKLGAGFIFSVVQIQVARELVANLENAR